MRAILAGCEVVIKQGYSLNGSLNQEIAVKGVSEANVYICPQDVISFIVAIRAWNNNKATRIRHRPPLHRLLECGRPFAGWDLIVWVGSSRCWYGITTNAINHKHLPDLVEDYVIFRCGILVVRLIPRHCAVA